MNDEKLRCAKMLYRNWHTVRCRNSAKHNEDGKWWCNAHKPSNVAAKRKTRDVRWAYDARISGAVGRVQNAEYELIEEALRRHPCCSVPIREATAKLIHAKEALQRLREKGAE